MADLPGLIKGASSGAGMGLQFLRHVERNAVIAFVIDVTSENPIQDVETVYQELLTYSEEFALKDKIVLFTKTDLISKEEKEKIDTPFTKMPCIFISSFTSSGLTELKATVTKILYEK